MAIINKQDDELVITLSTTEKIEALKGSFETPLQSVVKVEIVEDPIKEAHGLEPSHSKLVGMYIPGKSAVGTFLVGNLHDKSALIIVHHTDKRGVRITLEDAKFSELLIGCDDPEAIVKLLS